MIITTSFYSLSEVCDQDSRIVWASDAFVAKKSDLSELKKTIEMLLKKQSKEL